MTLDPEAELKAAREENELGSLAATYGTSNLERAYQKPKGTDVKQAT